jgi:hypothetical protein
MSVKRVLAKQIATRAFSKRKKHGDRGSQSSPCAWCLCRYKRVETEQRSKPLLLA